MAIFFCIVGFLLIVRFIFSGDHYSAAKPIPTKLEPTIKKVPDASQLNNFGLNLYKEKKYLEAIEYFKKALNVGFHVDYIYNRGDCYYKIGDYENALRDYDKAVYWNSNNYRFIIGRGNCRASLGDLNGALDDFTKAITLWPNPYSYSTRAVLKFKLMDYFGSIEDYNCAISINSTDYSLYVSRAEAKSKVGDFKGAIEDISLKINNVLKTNDISSLSKNSFIFYNPWEKRGNYYFKDNQADLAFEDWRFAAKLGSIEAKNKLEEYCNQTLKEVTSPKSVVDLSISFNISGNSAEGYKYFALWDYYPINRFPSNTLNQTDLDNRNHLFNFKDGKNPDLYAKKIASALINKFGPEKLAKKTLLIIPASNKLKSKIRFEIFCQKLSLYTGLLNGFNILNNNEKEKTPVHAGGNRNEDIIKFVSLTGNIKGKDLIVLDDVRTSGNSSNKVFKYLKDNGANEIIFIYISKTISTISENKFTY